jgi:hypothetical protein
MISSESLAAAALADTSTVGASGSSITPSGAPEGVSDATASAPADVSVTAGADASGPDDAQAPMNKEMVTIEIRPIIVSLYLFLSQIALPYTINTGANIPHRSVDKGLPK